MSFHENSVLNHDHIDIDHGTLLGVERGVETKGGVGACAGEKQGCEKLKPLGMGTDKTDRKVGSMRTHHGPWVASLDGVLVGRLPTATMCQ